MRFASFAILYVPFAVFAVEPGVEFVYVCQDGGNGAYEAFPDVARLADGRLMCVFYDGWKHVSLPDDAHPNGGRISAVYSSDEGRTWSAPVVVYDGPHDDRDPSVAQLNDGRILLNYFSLKPNGEGGHTGLGTWMIGSHNGGRTWSEPRQLAMDYYCSSPIRELHDGTLILGLYRETGDDANGAVIISKDKGSTWMPLVDINNGGLRLDAETDIIELNDYRLYAAQRTATESMRYATSNDRGHTWTVSAPIGFPGHSPYFHRAPDGTILLAHRLPQTSLHFSRDDAATWSGNILVDDFIGAYPSMATLTDGSILIVYYEEGEGSNIRARKFRISENGLEWLKW